MVNSSQVTSIFRLQRVERDDAGGDRGGGFAFPFGEFVPRLAVVAALPRGHGVALATEPQASLRVRAGVDVEHGSVRHPGAAVGVFVMDVETAVVLRPRRPVVAVGQGEVLFILPDGEPRPGVRPRRRIGELIRHDDFHLEIARHGPLRPRGAVEFRHRAFDRPRHLKDQLLPVELVLARFGRIERFAEQDFHRRRQRLLRHRRGGGAGSDDEEGKNPRDNPHGCSPRFWPRITSSSVHPSSALPSSAPRPAGASP